MTRLRIAPSSPKRMADLVLTLNARLRSRPVPLTPVHGGDPDRHLRWARSFARGQRLLLRWYGQGVYAGGVSLPRVWSDANANHYRLICTAVYHDQIWPPDGDERLREELGE